MRLAQHVLLSYVTGLGGVAKQQHLCVAAVRQEGAKAQGRHVPIEMNAEDVEMVRKWVCSSHTQRLKGVNLRWTRSRYEHWRMEIPAECLKEEDSDDDPGADEARTLLAIPSPDTHASAIEKSGSVVNRDL